MNKSETELNELTKLTTLDEISSERPEGNSTISSSCDANTARTIPKTQNYEVVYESRHFIPINDKKIQKQKKSILGKISDFLYVYFPCEILVFTLIPLLVHLYCNEILLQILPIISVAALGILLMLSAHISCSDLPAKVSILGMILTLLTFIKPLYLMLNASTVSLSYELIYLLGKTFVILLFTGFKIIAISKNSYGANMAVQLLFFFYVLFGTGAIFAKNRLFKLVDLVIWVFLMSFYRAPLASHSNKFNWFYFVSLSITIFSIIFFIKLMYLDNIYKLCLLKGMSSC